MKTGRRWIASSDVLSIFPTLIWKFELASEPRDTLNAKLLAALDKLRPSPSARAPAQGWQSHHGLHTLDELAGLVTYINEAVGAVLKFLKIGYDDFEITGCWANLNPPGASHRIHSHPNNFLSGVYYVRTQPDADTINFHDPRIQAGIIRPPVTELTGENTDQVVVKVDAGSLLVSGLPAALGRPQRQPGGADQYQLQRHVLGVHRTPQQALVVEG